MSFSDPTNVDPNDPTQPRSGRSGRQPGLESILLDLMNRVHNLEGGGISLGPPPTTIPPLNEIPPPIAPVSLSDERIVALGDPVNPQDGLNLRTGDERYDASGAAASFSASASDAIDAVQTLIETETIRAQDAESQLIPLAQKGSANGVPTLDDSTHIPIGQIPVEVVRGGSTTTPLGRSTTFLPLPTGDGNVDTANLNEVLANGGRIRPNPLDLEPIYQLMASLVIPSAIDVDFGIARLVLAGKFNMLQNSMCTPSYSASNASTVQGSSTVTFTDNSIVQHAAAGMQLAVESAGVAGGEAHPTWSSGTTYAAGDAVLGSDGNPYVSLQNSNLNHNPTTSPTWWKRSTVWLYGTIQSVVNNSTTNTYSVTLTGNLFGVQADFSVSGATAHLFTTRDVDIVVRGGIWDANTIWAARIDRYNAAFNSSLLRFRRIDGLIVQRIKLIQRGFSTGPGWCFGVDPADCTDFLIDDIDGDESSTCVEGTGPLYRGKISNCRGTTMDDMVALGAAGASGMDMEGDIIDVDVEGTYCNESLSAVKLLAGNTRAGPRVIRSTIRTVKGSNAVGGHNSPVKFQDYGGIGRIYALLDDVTCKPPTGFPTVTNTATYGFIKRTPPRIFQPRDGGFLGWTCDPGEVQSTFTPSAGFIYVVRFEVPETISVANLLMYLSAAGSSLTGGQNWAGIYDPQGNAGPRTPGSLIAETDDMTSIWTGSGGLKTVALIAQSGYTLDLPGGPGYFYWIGFVCNGTTFTTPVPPTFRCKGVSPASGGITSHLGLGNPYVASVPGSVHRIGWETSGIIRTHLVNLNGLSLSNSNFTQIPFAGLT